jgi:putative ABC transport system substrate-binding protein
LNRRDVITLLGAATMPLPICARAQQAIPVIGYLHSSGRASFVRFLAAFNDGLKESGYIEGRNLAIEYRWAEGRYERLPELAADLVSRRVALIATMGGEITAQAAQAAQAASPTIPVVFVMGGDPVKLGLVGSLARPTGNLTGISMFTAALESKRFGLLREMFPTARSIGVLINPSRPVAPSQLDEIHNAASQAGVQLAVVNAVSDAELEPAFTRLAEQRVAAMQVCADPYFFGRRAQIVALAAARRIPAMYEWRDFPHAGGLTSYGTDLADAYRQAGGYAGKILKGAKPADLPVMQATKFEFVINLKTAKVLGIEISPTLLARADEVIE